MASHLENNSYGVAIIAVGFVLLVVGAVALVMRFWSRRLKGQRFQLNDWFAVGAWVSPQISLTSTGADAL